MEAPLGTASQHARLKRGAGRVDQFARSALLYGSEGIERLRQSRVLIAGIGGVGGYVVEALARAGVGTLDVVDDDLVCLSNLNRQILATHATVGRAKVDVAEERIHAICPDTTVIKHRCFFLPETADRFDFTQYDFVVDAVDTVAAKIELVLRAKAANVPIISCMGAGNKVDAGRFRLADLYATQVCPLARVMRRELRKRGVTQLTVVYSDEEPLTPKVSAACNCEADCVCPPDAPRTCASRRSVPGSTPFAPAIAGFLIAGEVINRLATVTEHSSGAAEDRVAGNAEQNGFD